MKGCGSAIRKLFIALSTTLLVSCSMNAFTTQSFDYTPRYPEELMLRMKDTLHGNGVHDDFAVIIGANTEERHRGNISFAYQALIEHGYDRRDVFILDTASRTPYFPKTDTTSIDAVRQLFWYLSVIVEEHDTLLVYVTGHGVNADGQSFIKLNAKELMQSNVFLDMVDALGPATGVMFMDQCYWGIELRPSGCQWTTLVVTSSDRTSVGTAFPRLFWSNVRMGLSIQESFDDAKDDDPNTYNRPRIFTSTCAQGFPIALDRVNAR